MSFLLCWSIKQIILKNIHRTSLRLCCLSQSTLSLHCNFSLCPHLLHPLLILPPSPLFAELLPKPHIIHVLIEILQSHSVLGVLRVLYCKMNVVDALCEILRHRHWTKRIQSRLGRELRVTHQTKQQPCRKGIALLISSHETPYTC